MRRRHLGIPLAAACLTVAVFLASFALVNAALPPSKDTSINAVSASLNTSVKTDPIVAVAPAPVYHNCTPNAPFQPVSCWLVAGGEFPPLPHVVCPEGGTLDPECENACYGVFRSTTDHACGVLRDALTACCESYNAQLAAINADYDSDIADAEAAFQECTKSPARCEAEYCAAINTAWVAYAATQAQLWQEYWMCQLSAWNECDLNTTAQQQTYINCCLSCCP